MPFYEYECQSCNELFTELRSHAQLDDPIDCPRCGASETRKVLSGFAVGSERKEPAGPCGTSEACGGCPMGN